ncbi:MAG: NAD(P)H-binding protein [Deltaproteobacteria bacterium]|nr:NAD(P)H-binding protein [Deltaproteobacteria bacterium]
MRVLIAGCGDVGGQLGLTLARAGVNVVGLRRDAARIPAPIEAIAADLVDPTTFPAWPADVETVFYTAAADGPDETAYRGAYVAGLSGVLSWIHAHGAASSVRRVFFTSSTAVYGQEHGEWVDESSATEPRHFTGRILLEAEELALASGLPVTIVRFAGIYGPGRTRLVTGVRDGTLTCHDGAPTYSNRIHRDDCAGFLAHLALHVPAPAPIYVGVDDEPTDRCTVYHWLADRLGTAPPHRALEPPSSGPGGRGGSKRCSNARLRATGYRLRFPTFRDGYGTLVGDCSPPRPALAE